MGIPGQNATNGKTASGRFKRLPRPTRRFQEGERTASRCADGVFDTADICVPVLVWRGIRRSGWRRLDRPQPMRTGAETITVVVGDDHPLMRDAMKQSLAALDSVDVVATATGAASLAQSLAEHEPDVAVIDLRLGDGDAFDVLRTARDNRLRTRVIVMSSFQEPTLVHRALQEGAAGYLSKDSDVQTLQRAVLRAARGETVVGAELQAGLLALIGRQVEQPPVALSARELSTVRLAARGLKEREIAAQLMVSPSSVKSYLRRCYEKLGAVDRASAVAEAARRGLLS